MLFYAKKSVTGQMIALLALLGLSGLLAQILRTEIPLRASPETAIISLAALSVVGAIDGLTLLLHLGIAGRAFVREIFTTLEGIFGRLSPAGVIGAGVVAGAGEELLFRGIIQNAFGLPAAVVLFALAHMATKPLLRLLLWTAMEGLWFGLLYETTRNLLYPMVVHGLHDIVGILAIQLVSRRPKWRRRFGIR